MDYIREYRSFINSHYVSEGIRITIGLTLPAILLSYFHQLAAGIVISLGASCVIMVDNAGPIHHRRNAMFICDGIIFFVALATGFANHSPIILGVLISLFCFSFSMIGVYGSRASSIGLAALFVMVLNIDRNLQGKEIVINALYVFLGGIWYTLLSLFLYSFRPYKLTQQAMGDCIRSTATFLRIKAAFYDKDTDYDKNYQSLLQQQVTVHEKQNLLRELLFKSRNIVKESTPVGRILVMIFLDTVDLFERVLSSHQDYQLMHRQFDKSDVLQQFRQVILDMANDLDEIGTAVMSGKSSEDDGSIHEEIKKLKNNFNAFRDGNRTADNVEAFISLRQILDGIEDIGDRLHTLHTYTGYDSRIGKMADQKLEYEQFVSHQYIDPKLLLDNFSLQSNIFRHSLRVALATTVGYIVSKFFPFGHSYWILLTIIVILKPAYSLTKKRNYDRLLGTLAGAAIGFTILYFFRERNVVLVCMIILMAGAYSFMRTRYFIFVLLMTPYILLLFYLLNSHDFKTIILDRVIDTFIGSGIAFLANLFVATSWVHEQFTDYLVEMIEENINYFRDVAGVFADRPVTITQYKLSRKRAFVALANLSDAFSRMLSEPKRKQKNMIGNYQFVVANHMLTSHIATLSSYLQLLAKKYQSDDYLPIINLVVSKLNHAKALLQQKNADQDGPVNKDALRYLNDKVNVLMEQRKSELKNGVIESNTRKSLSELKFITDQFNFITKIATDIEKLAYTIN